MSSQLHSLLENFIAGQKAIANESEIVDASRRKRFVDRMLAMNCGIAMVPTPQSETLYDGRKRYRQVPCGKGVVVKQVDPIQQPAFLDRGGKWLDSHGGPPETVCTKPFHSAKEASDGLEASIRKDFEKRQEKLAASGAMTFSDTRLERLPRPEWVPGYRAVGYRIPQHLVERLQAKMSEAARKKFMAECYGGFSKVPPKVEVSGCHFSGSPQIVRRESDGERLRREFMNPNLGEPWEST